MERIALTTELLVEAGYDLLTEEDAAVLLRALYDAGSTLMGARLVSRMSSEQMDYFDRLIEAGDEALALSWIEQIFPDHQDDVLRTFHELIEDLRQTALKARASYSGRPLDDLLHQKTEPQQDDATG